MIKAYLNHIYNYYPKGITYPFEQEYLETKEYLRLQDAVEQARHWDMNSILGALLSIEYYNHDIPVKILNYTNFNFLDRCFVIQYRFIIGKKIKAITLNISVLLPVFCVYYLERNMEGVVIGKPISNPEEFYAYDFNHIPDIYSDLVKLISDHLIGLGYARIQNELLDHIIPDISFETIGLNKMTLFNALFMNEPYCAP